MERKKLKFISISLIFFQFLLISSAFADPFVFSPNENDSEIKEIKNVKKSLKDSEGDEGAFVYQVDKESKGLKSLKKKQKKEEEASLDPFMLDESKKLPTKLGQRSDKEKNNSFITGTQEDKDFKMDTSTGEEDKIKSYDGHIPGSISSENFQQSLPYLKKHSHKDFYFRFFKDSFKYSNGIGKDFNATFRNKESHPKSSWPFMFQMGGSRLFPTVLGNWGIGLNLGFSYSSGKGYFKNSDGSRAEESDTLFRFWTIPADLKFSYDIVAGSFLRFGVAGGPSLIGVVQNRSDLQDNSDGRKNVRRYGYGYFYEATVKFELLGLFSDEYIRKMFHQYDMTNTFLTLTMRSQHYSQFSKSQAKLPSSSNLKISGKSFGLGMCYEFF